VLLQGSQDWRTPHLGNLRSRFIVLNIQVDAGKKCLVIVTPALRLAQLVGAAAAAHKLEDSMQGGLVAVLIQRQPGQGALGRQQLL